MTASRLINSNNGDIVRFQVVKTVDCLPENKIEPQTSSIVLMLGFVSSGSKKTDGEIVIGSGRISISRHVGLDRGSGSSAVLGLNPDLLV